MLPLVVWSYYVISSLAVCTHQKTNTAQVSHDVRFFLMSQFFFLIFTRKTRPETDLMKLDPSLTRPDGIYFPLTRLEILFNG